MTYQLSGTFSPHPWWATPFFFLADDFGWLGWLIIVLAIIGTIAVLCQVTTGLTWLLLYLPPLRRARTTPPAADGRDRLRAVVRGGSIPELEAAALDRGRDLYGPDAILAVAGVENVATSVMDHGQFVATVYVRHLDALAPVARNVSTQEASTQS